MTSCAQRPKCHKTNARKCVVPNPWVIFIATHGGKGYSREYLSSEYKRWRIKTFRQCGMSSSKAHVEKRQALLCDILAPNTAARKTPKANTKAAATRARRTPKAKATPVVKPPVKIIKRVRFTPTTKS
ncbi:unnamed protein product [Ectocarpus sp. 6 AP-2014]